VRESRTPEEKRAIAHHEAGHAAMLWLFGYGSDILYADMRGHYGVHAQVMSRLPNLARMCKEASPVPAWLRVQVKQRMMYLLAGYAAASRLRQSPNEKWREEELEEGEWEYEETGDIHKTVELARAVWGNNGNAWRMVHRMASWADEALCDPRLWAAVKALGEELLTVKTRMCGNGICRIMDNAWGEEIALPYMEMGPTWRRRFSCKTG
jgi:ribosomal protein L39E